MTIVFSFAARLSGHIGSQVGKSLLQSSHNQLGDLRFAHLRSIPLDQSMMFLLSSGVPKFSRLFLEVTDLCLQCQHLRCYKETQILHQPKLSGRQDATSATVAGLPWLAQAILANGTQKPDRLLVSSCLAGFPKVAS